MKTHIIHIVVATLLMILCAVAAALLPPLWQGVSGRDFQPQSATMGILILLLAAVLRVWRRWPVLEFLGAVVCAELFALCAIAHFTGYTWLELFESLNLSWLRTMSVFIAVPWLVGLFVGSLLLGVRQRFTVILVIAQVGLLAACKGQTNPISGKPFQIPAGGYPVSVEESGSAKVDALVRDLVSRRPAPYRSGYYDPPTDVVFSDRYSTPEVESALKRLKDMGPAAFPALVKHLGDDRYSYSAVVAAWLNFRVGDAIVEVLDDGHYMHSGYKFRKTPSGSVGGYLSFDDYLKARGAEAWAEWAKNKSRLDIQMNFIDWCVEKENERGFSDDAQKKQILGNYEAARQEMMKVYSETDRLTTKGSQPIRSETNSPSSTAGSRR